jgi:hypothetical protein
MAAGCSVVQRRTLERAERVSLIQTTDFILRHSLCARRNIAQGLGLHVLIVTDDLLAKGVELYSVVGISAF